jgi:hypothetical protein
MPANENFTIVAQHREIVGPIVGYATGDGEQLLEYPVGKAPAGAVRQRIATAEPGVDLGNAQRSVGGQKALYAQRAADAG